MSDNIRGVGFLVLALLIFSLQDIAMKFIGGDYSVIQIVILRSLAALPCTLVLLRFEGKRGRPTTQQHKLEYMRGIFLFRPWAMPTLLDLFIMSGLGLVECT